MHDTYVKLIPMCHLYLHMKKKNGIIYYSIITLSIILFDTNHFL